MEVPADFILPFSTREHQKLQGLLFRLSGTRFSFDYRAQSVHNNVVTF